MSSEPLAELLLDLYRRETKLLPYETYLGQHASPEFVDGAVRVFRFYEPWLPRSGAVLDWGCRHAPDACLIRARFGDGVAIEGCDLSPEATYRTFHDYAGLRYQALLDHVGLPYPDGRFDAVIASGVLEHVPMAYESLKELYRVMKPGGRLIVTYLPNRGSYEEWRLRRRAAGEAHRKLFSRRQIRGLLLQAGFWPLTTGFQTQLDSLPHDGGSVWLRGVARAAQLHRLTSCLCLVAEKLTSF
jgi:SAM-dependent methyltransferase